MMNGIANFSDGFSVLGRVVFFTVGGAEFTLHTLIL